MKPLTHEWSQKAEGDYTVAATLWQAESAVYDAICFHAQQCIEKYLKAWLGASAATPPHMQKEQSQPTRIVLSSWADRGSS
jgi:HEPN domain-containing protein